jgi:hypothetical protein
MEKLFYATTQKQRLGIYPPLHLYCHSKIIQGIKHTMETVNNHKKKIKAYDIS